VATWCCIIDGDNGRVIKRVVVVVAVAVVVAVMGVIKFRLAIIPHLRRMGENKEAGE
jgi:ABC-type Fe3+-siderophore transport system permease subunit